MVQFINTTEEEFLSSKLLYKFMPLENALRTLEDQSFWFANPSTWKDPFEKRFLEAKYIRSGKEVNFTWKGKIFCTCLTQTMTSEAYWNTYSNGCIGIEFRINRKVLLDELKKRENLYKIFIGKVEYKKTADIVKPELQNIPFNPPVKGNVNSDTFAARLFLLKRVAYAYENEIRIIIVKKSATKEKGIKLHYDCANTDIIRQLVLDPNIGDYTYNMLRDLFINKYGFSPLVKGGKEQKRVLRSQLYAKQKQAALKID